MEGPSNQVPSFDLYFTQPDQAGPSSGAGRTQDMGNGTWTQSYSTCNSKVELTLKRDQWVLAEVVPRVVGAAAFIWGVLGVVAQFVIALSCVNTKGCKEGAFSIPYRFSIGDTARAEPCYKTGLGFTMIAASLLVWVGWCRRARVMLLCCGPLTALRPHNRLSDVLGIFGVAGLICSSALRPGGSTDLETLVRAACFFAALASVLGYAYVQVLHVERILLSHNIIEEPSNAARKKLMAISVVCIGASLILLVTRDVLGPATNGNHTFYVVVGIPLISFQIGSLMAILATFGLTDFTSLVYNAQRLVDLGKQDPKALREINMVAG